MHCCRSYRSQSALVESIPSLGSYVEKHKHPWPVVDPLWEVNLGGQTFCRTIVCSVKLNRRMNKQTADNVAFMTLYLLNQSQPALIRIRTSNNKH